MLHHVFDKTLFVKRQAIKAEIGMRTILIDTAKHPVMRRVSKRYFCRFSRTPSCRLKFVGFSFQ